MDIVKIESKFVTVALSRIISKAVTKSSGCSTDLKLRSVDIRHEEGGNLAIQADLDVSTSISQDQIEELIKDLL